MTAPRASSPSTGMANRTASRQDRFFIDIDLQTGVVTALAEANADTVALGVIEPTPWDVQHATARSQYLKDDCNPVQAAAERVTVQTWRGELAEGWSGIAGAGSGGYVIYLEWMGKSTSALPTGIC